MRIIAIALGLFALFSSSAWGENAACRWYMSGPQFTEWVEQGEQRGARIVARDPKWQLHDLGHAANGAGCQTCSNEEIAGATLWLGVNESAPSAIHDDLESAVAPDVVARMMARFPFQLSGADFQAKTAAVPASIGDLEGRLRLIGIESRDGHSHEVLALRVVKGCVSMVGILYAKDGATIALDQFSAFVQAIGIEWYKPASDPQILNPPPAEPNEGLPLGDAFRRRYMEQR
jgi:hypothetical protein